MDWFQIGKEVPQGYVLSSQGYILLINLNAEYIMQNATLDKAKLE